MRTVALDIGEKRIGVAISDPRGRVATPLAVLDARETLAEATALRKLLSDYDDIGALVVGLPLSMNGAQGPQALRCKAAGERIAGILGLPLVLADERLSSTEAQRRMAEAGADSRKRRGSVDMVAAAVVLQSYLDAKVTEGSE
jgi:putative Holliday junction resolvase